MQTINRIVAGLGPALMAIVLIYAVGAGLTGSLTLDRPAFAQAPGEVPGNSLGNTSDSEFWRAVRSGEQGSVSIPDKKAGVMVNSEGEAWRNLRNGLLSSTGIWILLGTIAVLALFFAVRGRIKVDSGLCGRTVERFNFLERFAHWLTAGTFIALGLTGLNVLYGRYLFGSAGGAGGDFGGLHQVFATITFYGKWVHFLSAIGFMVGVVLIFVLWLRDNIPDKLDLKWFAVAGGLFSKGVHPPAKKFNAGQKVIFWVVVLGGLSLSLTGISLLFPFELGLFSKTFAVLNIFGLGLPTALSGIEEMQYAQIWHLLVSLVMIAIIVAHIYIGSLGMEGAFDAMNSGQVDENWAREHHALWVAEIKGETPPDDSGPPGGATADTGDDKGSTPQTA